MKGAKEYAKLFETGQYGRFYITSGSHARGLTFYIQLLPDGEKAIPNGRDNLCLNNDSVVIYGVVSGKKGWTEEYSWIHQGKWQEDFDKLIEERKSEIEEERIKRLLAREEAKKKEEERIRDLLDKYEN